MTFVEDNMMFIEGIRLIVHKLKRDFDKEEKHKVKLNIISAGEWIRQYKQLFDCMIQN